jgi:hypothetical protein
MTEPRAQWRFSRATSVALSFLMLASVLAQQPSSQALLAEGGTPQLLIASSAAPDATADTSVTSSQVDAALSQAIADWQAAAPDADLSGITATASDLAGLELGQSSGSSITIDGNAAGWGWSVSYPGEAGRMDLVTVMRHEVGHVLGLAHAGGIMASSLSPDASSGVTSSDAKPLLVSEPTGDPEPVVEASAAAVEPHSAAETTEADPVVESDPAAAEVAASMEPDPAAESTEAAPAAETTEPDPAAETTEPEPAA